MCYNVPLGKVPPSPNYMGFQGSNGENVGAHVLVFHGSVWLQGNGFSSHTVTMVQKMV